MIHLSNHELSVSIKKSGAELCSLIDKKSKTEYIWQADPGIWSRHSPVLFPIVGRLQNNTYVSGGKNYSLPQHGFARDMDFTVLSQAEDKIVFSLGYSEETLKKYPYKFELQIGYTLSGKKLTVSYKVLNRQDSDIYFSLGAHPGFVCPLHAGESYEDYSLEFNKPEHLSLHVLKDGLISRDQLPYLAGETKIPLSYELFKNDALVFEKYQSDFISLKHKNKGEVFKFHFAGYPFLGIWSKPGPFVCIEPWYGIADFTDHSGILEEKTGIQKLGKGQTFESEWSVELL